MTHPIPEDDYDEDDPLGPSFALPPLYVLRTGERCPKCRTLTPVFALGCAAFHDAEDGMTIERFHILRRIEQAPESVLDLLKAHCPGYFMDRARSTDRPYLMNHCRCGARLDDRYLHGDVGAAFWPQTPEGYGDIALFLLPVEAPIPIACSWSLGGGEYLETGRAVPN